MRLQELFDLSGRVAVVTGGSIGLGKQMAEALAEAKASLVLAARKVERCEEEAALIREQFKVEALAIRCDVSDAEQVKILMQQTVERLGRLDILVNNAGITWGAPAEDYPLDKWRQVIEVNLTGSFIAAQEAAKVMKQQGGGSIINIASMAGFVGVKAGLMDAVAYNASKGGVITMTRDLAVKWAPYGIRVNAIAPGWFPTHMSRGLLEKRGQQLLDHIPLGRFGGDDDLKGAVVYLASRASNYVTGHILSVDGGWVVN